MLIEGVCSARLGSPSVSLVISEYSSLLSGHNWSHPSLDSSSDCTSARADGHARPGSLPVAVLEHQDGGLVDLDSHRLALCCAG